MVGLAFASVGAAGAPAAGWLCGAEAGTVGGPATILESVLGTAVGFGVAGLAEASVAGAGGTVLVEAVADGLLDCVSAGATGALAATDRVRNTGMAGEPDDSGSRGRADGGRHEDHTRRAREAWCRGQVAPFRTEIPGGTHQIPLPDVSPCHAGRYNPGLDEPGCH